MTRLKVSHTIDEEVLEKIEEEARRLDISRSRVIEMTLRKALEDRERSISIVR
ncbi:MAG: ribbon-helix-helix protein, CopG family [Dehalococcoidales bacterium]|nr:ribbon-helix-helix protein, CopG family [Dehalococcoidales bacterium]